MMMLYFFLMVGDDGYDHNCCDATMAVKTILAIVMMMETTPRLQLSCNDDGNDGNFFPFVGKFDFN